MNKPFGLEKSYLFLVLSQWPYLKVSLGCDRQIKLALTHQGSMKSILIKSCQQRPSATIQQWSCIGFKAEPQMTRKYNSYQSCDIPYCHHQSLSKEYWSLSPLQLLYLKGRGYSWKQAWEFRQVVCIRVTSKLKTG